MAICFGLLVMIFFEWCTLIFFRYEGDQTPIDLAYQEKDPDISIVLYLIEQGANVYLKPAFEARPGFNFLDCAIERKDR